MPKYRVLQVLIGIDICILVRGWIKETARVDSLVIPQRAGWITSYPPVVNGYVIQTLLFIIGMDTKNNY